MRFFSAAIFSFTFDDFLKSYKMLRKMGPLQGVLKMIPGLGKQLEGLDQVDEKQLGRVEAAGRRRLKAAAHRDDQLSGAQFARRDVRGHDHERTLVEAAGASR